MINYKIAAIICQLSQTQKTGMHRMPVFVILSCGRGCYPLVSCEMARMALSAKPCSSSVMTLPQYGHLALALISTGAPQFGQLTVCIVSPFSVFVPVGRTRSHS